MRRLSLLTIFSAASLLSSGFTNILQKSKEPEIKGIVCGTDLFMNVLIDNFPKEEIFSNEAIDKIYDEFYNASDEYFYKYIFDTKTGKLYESDDSSNTLLTVLKPYYQEEIYDSNITYTYKGEIRGKSLKVSITEYENRKLKNSWVDDIHLKKLTNTYIDDDGEKVVERCIYFPIPGTLKILELGN